MPVQRFRVVVLVRGVPQLDRQVRRAGRYCQLLPLLLRSPRTHHGTLGIKVNVHDGLGVAFDCPLKLASLPVPYLHARVFARAGQDGPCRVERYTCDG